MSDGPRHFVSWTPLEWLFKKIIWILLGVIVIGGGILLGKGGDSKKNDAAASAPAVEQHRRKPGRAEAAPAAAPSYNSAERVGRVHSNGLPNVQSIPN